MKLNIASVCALLLAAPIPKGLAKSLVGGHFYRHRGVDSIVRRDALAIVGREMNQVKRAAHPQEADATTVSRAASSGSESASNFNQAAFNVTATKACASALSNLAGVVNPSGIVACYNVPFYDNSTGVFQADIRLYQMSQPVDEFAGTTPRDYMLSVSITKATLSSPQTMISSAPVQNKAATGGTIQMLQGFTNIGQLSDSLIMSKLTQSDLRVLMIPNITMAATNPVTSNIVSTTLSSDTLSYVAGELVQPNGTPTNITVPEANTLSTAIVASASKFVLPGTYIRIYPVGLIITGIWTGIFLVVVGLGTIGRYQFRQHYRQRMQRAQVGGFAPKSI